jgi:hypothetical protein
VTASVTDSWVDFGNSAGESNQGASAEASSRVASGASFALGVVLGLAAVVESVTQPGSRSFALPALGALVALLLVMAARRCSPGAPWRDALWLSWQFRWTLGAFSLVYCVGWYSKKQLLDLVVHTSALPLLVHEGSRELWVVHLAVLALVPPLLLAEAWALLFGCLERTRAAALALPVGVASAFVVFGALLFTQWLLSVSPPWHFAGV